MSLETEHQIITDRYSPSVVMEVILLLVAVMICNCYGLPNCSLPEEHVLNATWQAAMTSHCHMYGHSLQQIPPYKEIYTRHGIVAPPIDCNCDPREPDCSLIGCDEVGGPHMCGPPDHTTSDVSKRSLCPYGFHEVHDIKRYPVSLVEATCLCPTCDGLAPATNTVCEPVYYNLPVLKLTGEADANGTCIYVETFQPIATSCACVVNRSESNRRMPQWKSTKQGEAP